MTAENAPDTITLEVGDNTDAYEIEYVMLERLKFSGIVAQDTAESPVAIEADYFGRQVTKTSFTGAITAPSVTNMHGGLSRIYADPAWADRGTTEITNILRAWEVEIMTGFHPKFFGSANRFFDVHGESFIDVMVTLTFEAGASADAEFDLFKAGTKQSVSIQVLGPDIGVGDPNSLVLNVAGAYESVIPLSEEDRGNNIHTAVFHSLYDITGATNFEALCTTETAAI